MKWFSSDPAVLCRPAGIICLGLQKPAAETSHILGQGRKSPVVLVFGRRQRGPVRTLNWPASKKRQGTKSREVGHRLSSGRYEDLMAAPLSMVSATRARGDVQCQHTGEPKIVQWTSRQAREVQQWTASELIDGYRFERRQPGRTLPQLPRFGMSVAQEYF
jgi:hypothetical protein